MRIRRLTAVCAGVLTAIVMLAPQAGANSASSSYYYPGGDRLEANVWIQTFSNWSGCGNWQTSAKLWGSNPSLASWIKNTAAFHADGWGASLSGGGGGVSFSGGSSDASVSWTNYNAWISDLAGNICGNWLTWYISASSTAVSYVPQYGSPRVASASV